MNRYRVAITARLGPPRTAGRTGRVAGTHRCAPAPSEPGVRLAPHRAQASLSGSTGIVVIRPVFATALGPFTAEAVSNLSSGSHTSPSSPSGSPDSCQHPFGSGTSPYPAGYPPTRRWRPTPASAVSRRLSAHRHSLLGHPSPAEELGLPCGRLTGHTLRGVRTSTGLSRSTRARHDRGGCPLYPEDGGAHPTGNASPAGTRRFPAASPCTPPATSHPVGLPLTRHHRGFTGVHPSGLPLRLWPLDGTAPLGLIT